MIVWRTTWQSGDDGTCYAWSATRTEAERIGRRMARQNKDRNFEYWEADPIQIPNHREGVIAWLNEHLITDNG